MSDENGDFSLRKLMEQGEEGSINEPCIVQTIFEGGKVRLDLPEVAATYYAELVAERDALAEALTEIERLYYTEDKDASWRAAQMKAIAYTTLAAIQETTDD